MKMKLEVFVTKDGLPHILVYSPNWTEEAAAEVIRRTEAHDGLVTLLKMAICPNCDGSGAIPHQVSEKRYVTRDMASDAGDSTLEGSLCSEDQWEAEQCQWCYEKEQALAGEPKEE